MTTRVYELYAVKAGSLDEARVLVERALGIKMEGRNGPYCGDYFNFDRGRANLKLQSNVDNDEEFEDGEGRAELAFPEVALLLYVNSAEEVPDLVATLEANPEEFKRLRAKQV